MWGPGAPSVFTFLFDWQLVVVFPPVLLKQHCLWPTNSHQHYKRKHREWIKHSQWTLLWAQPMASSDDLTGRSSAAGSETAVGTSGKRARIRGKLTQFRPKSAPLDCCLANAGHWKIRWMKLDLSQPSKGKSETASHHNRLSWLSWLVDCVVKHKPTSVLVCVCWRLIDCWATVFTPPSLIILFSLYSKLERIQTI